MAYVRTDLNLLNIDKVSMHYGDRVILREVDAKINDIECEETVKGQVICFLGPSGIGKSQLSRIIAGLQQPTTGGVFLRDNKPTQAGSVCMVPQKYPLFEYATVMANLIIAGQQAGLNAEQIQAKAAGFIEAFELQSYLRMYPKDLSGGTRQRVAIARQLMCATNYMVMDEPFSGLDPIMKMRATTLITKLAGMDTYNTIIVVTHDITEGLSVADTVWLMGYEPDPNDAAKFLPGARLVEEYDLAALDLCWHPDISNDQRFLDFVGHIKNRFQTLR